MVIPVHDEDGIARRGFRPWVVWSLLFVNVLVFVFLALLSAQALYVIGYNFGVVPALLMRAADTSVIGLLVWPEVTLVTYMFMHASWLHLTANMIFLWVLGDDVEAATGHFRFLAFYLLCGITGALVQVISDPGATAPVIGASAAISGIVGAYLLLRPYARMTVLVLGLITVRLRAYWVIGFWVVWQAVNVWWPLMGSQTAYWSHVGGFVAGLLLVPIMRKKDVALFS